MKRPVRVDKPWGHEIIWAKTEKYVGKILHVKAGESLSFQYHRWKDETIHLLRGKMKLTLQEPGGRKRTVVLGEGRGLRIPPRLRHRMEAIRDCDVLEASTPQLGDVVRLEDRYGRVKAAGGAAAGRAAPRGREGP